MTAIPRPPTPTERIRALQRPSAHSQPYHVTGRKLSLAASDGAARGALQVGAVRMERRKDDCIELKIGGETVSVSLEDARAIGAALLQLAR